LLPYTKTFTLPFSFSLSFFFLSFTFFVILIYYFFYFVYLYNLTLDTFYYLPNAVIHVVKTIKQCVTCLQNTPQNIHPPLVPLKSSRPFHILEVDFFGPMEAAPGTGDQYS